MIADISARISTRRRREKLAEYLKWENAHGSRDLRSHVHCEYGWRLDWRVLRRSGYARSWRDAIASPPSWPTSTPAAL
jgi:hypothetical protein